MGRSSRLSTRPIIVAHRGLHTRYPENSRGAFRAAQSATIAWAECDVQASADLVPVVLHDERLDRTTTGQGLVSTRRWDELKDLHLRDHHGNPHWCKLPRLEDLCGPVMASLVEIKPPDAATLVKAVIEVMRTGRRTWMLQSFDEANLVHALAHDLNLPVAYLVEDRPSLEAAVAAGWERIHLFHELLDTKTSAWLRDKGVTVGAWTVNTPADIRRVAKLGAEMIISDQPLLARELLQDELGPATNRNTSAT